MSPELRTFRGLCLEGNRNLGPFLLLLLPPCSLLRQTNWIMLRRPTDETEDIGDTSLDIDRRHNPRNRRETRNQMQVLDRYVSFRSVLSSILTHWYVPSPTIHHKHQPRTPNEVARAALVFSKDLEVQSRYQRLHNLVNQIFQNATRSCWPSERSAEQQAMERWRTELFVVFEPDDSPQAFYVARITAQHGSQIEVFNCFVDDLAQVSIVAKEEGLVRAFEIYRRRTETDSLTCNLASVACTSHLG